MQKTYCDFCGKEITHSDDRVDITFDGNGPRSYFLDETKHAHFSCAVRVKNKLNEFIAENQQTNETE